MNITCLEGCFTPCYNITLKMIGFRWDKLMLTTKAILSMLDIHFLLRALLYILGSYLKSSFFTGIYYIRSILYTNCNTFLNTFQQPTVLSDTKTSAHLMIIRMNTAFQVTSNQLTSKTDKGFNIHWTKSRLSNNHQTINLPLDWST